LQVQPVARLQHYATAPFLPADERHEHVRRHGRWSADC
jgi:hypothetical protein